MNAIEIGCESEAISASNGIALEVHFDRYDGKQNLILNNFSILFDFDKFWLSLLLPARSYDMIHIVQHEYA